MTNNLFIILRHAETKVEKGIKNSKWELSHRGKQEAFNLTKLNIINDVDIIVTSNEDKAYKTAVPLANKLKRNITRVKELNEINRDNGQFLENEDYLYTMKRCMTERDQSFNTWETADRALNRFSKKIQEIESRYNNKKILIVAHGVVINLYFGKLLRKMDIIFERYLTNTFCDYGIIQKNKVIKDISKL
ncbi:MAG: histidine phosphatase family protein [Promethearchaeota archaeon]|jgi:broad specificity phosphatase PhoE